MSPCSKYLPSETCIILGVTCKYKNQKKNTPKTRGILQVSILTQRTWPLLDNRIDGFCPENLLFNGATYVSILLCKRQIFIRRWVKSVNSHGLLLTDQLFILHAYIICTIYLSSNFFHAKSVTWPPWPPWPPWPLILIILIFSCFLYSTQFYPILYYLMD